MLGEKRHRQHWAAGRCQTGTGGAVGQRRCRTRSIWRSLTSSLVVPDLRLRVAAVVATVNVVISVSLDINKRVEAPAELGGCRSELYGCRSWR
jgi:hypothetical protein